MNYFMCEEQLKNRIRKTGMLGGQDRVLCGLSGGADSVFLFLLLRDLSEEIGFALRAVHVHHGIRGADADDDAAFVRDLCEEKGIPLRVFKRDIPKEAKERGMSLEEAGRAARYESFLEAAGKWKEEQPALEGRIRIALAHHMQDQAESVLFRLARGTGIRGIAAMRSVTDSGDGEVQVIRPLLDISREEIEADLKLRGQGWREDKTNAEGDAARNRIRHEILPLLVREVNSGAVRHIAAAASDAEEVNAFLRAESRIRSKRYLKDAADGQGKHILEALLAEEMPAMQSEILYLALSLILPGMKDVGRVHMEALRGLFRKECGKRIDLPYGASAVREAGGVLLTTVLKTAAEPPSEEAVLLPGSGCTFRDFCFFAEEEREVPDSFPEKRYTKTIDYGKIKGTLVVRNRKKGDFLTVRSDGARKSLSDYFTDQKVPQSERDSIAVVADGSEIVWVLGMRIGYRYRVTDKTERAVTLKAEKLQET